jgi:L-fuconolactonase
VTAPPPPAPSRRPPRIDAHQHYWRLARGDYGWLTPADGPIYRDFGPEDLSLALARAGIDRTVLVQAAPTVAETRFLLDLAARTASVAGVVGWAPLDAPDGPAIVHALAAEPGLKGLRPMIHDLPDVDWMLRPEVGAGLRAVAAHGLAFDALVRPAHLPNLRRLLDRHPDLRVVIDHAAKPDIAGARWDPWAADMRALARDTAAWVKLSGLVTEAGPGWAVTSLRPYADHVLEHFGPARTLFGSDWPVVTRRATYAEWVAAAEALLAGLERPERDRIMGANAVAFYRL